MIHVLLLILKIIGIALLAVLGLLLLIVLLVLLVPVRYRGKVVKKDALNAKGTVSWLLHIVHFSILYDENGTVMALRVFGIKIYPQKKKSESAKKKTSAEPNRPVDYRDGKIADNLSEEDNAKAFKKDTLTENPEKPKAETLKTETSREETSKAETPKEETPKPVTEITERLGSEKKKENTGIEKPKLTKEEKQELKAEKQALKAEKKKLKAERKAAAEEKRRQRRKAKKENEGPGLAEKLKNLYNKLRGTYEKGERIVAIIEDERFKHGFSVAKKRLFKIIRVILPRTVSGEFAYGFDDPSTTGYITAALSAVYGIYGKRFNIYPDFENKVLECDVFFKGRITLISIVIHALKVITNKDCRYAYKLIKSEFKDKDDTAVRNASSEDEEG